MKRLIVWILILTFIISKPVGLLPLEKERNFSFKCMPRLVHLMDLLEEVKMVCHKRHLKHGHSKNDEIIAPKIMSNLLQMTPSPTYILPNLT